MSTPRGTLFRPRIENMYFMDPYAQICKILLFNAMFHCNINWALRFGKNYEDRNITYILKP
jgi:hypothetical protein